MFGVRLAGGRVFSRNGVLLLCSLVYRRGGSFRVNALARTLTHFLNFDRRDSLGCDDEGDSSFR